jgi:hypothetical protein
MSLLLFSSFACLLCLTPFIATFAVISSHCGPSRIQQRSPFGPTASFLRLQNFQTRTAPVPRNPTSTEKASDSTVLQSYCARIVPLTYAQYEPHRLVTSLPRDGKIFVQARCRRQTGSSRMLCKGCARSLKISLLCCSELNFSHFSKFKRDGVFRIRIS